MLRPGVDCGGWVRARLVDSIVAVGRGPGAPGSSTRGCSSESSSALLLERPQAKARSSSLKLFGEADGAGLHVGGWLFGVTTLVRKSGYLSPDSTRRSTATVVPWGLGRGPAATRRVGQEPAIMQEEARPRRALRWGDGGAGGEADGPRGCSAGGLGLARARGATLASLCWAVRYAL
jgi:hypothetical protein